MLPLLQLFYIASLPVRFCRHIPDSCRKLIKLCIPSPSYVCPYTGSSESSASCSPCLIHTVCSSLLVSGPEKSSASFSSGSPKEGIRQKNIHAARNTRRTAVPFPTVLFMDFIIGIHNSMLNCGPYHTVCNIKNSAIIPAQMVSAIRIPNSPPIIFICISSCNTSYLFGTSPL